MEFIAIPFHMFKILRQPLHSFEITISHKNYIYCDPTQISCIFQWMYWFSRWFNDFSYDEHFHCSSASCVEYETKCSLDKQPKRFICIYNQCLPSLNLNTHAERVSNSYLSCDAYYIAIIAHVQAEWNFPMENIYSSDFD